MFRQLALVWLLALLLQPHSAIAEDPFCSRHGVSEAVCTRCKPKLAVIFKAKGDWCAEHELPESFCPICHPERGGRPQGKSLAADPAPADGTKVKFVDPKVARLVGIETVKATQRPASAAVAATVRLAFDTTRMASVNARAAGVVREIKADIGTAVETGTALAVLESTTVGADRSRLVAAKARLDVASKTLARERSLASRGISAHKDVLEAEQQVSAARAELEALQAALGAVGDVTGGRSSYTLSAPIAGTVTRREISAGQLVDTEHTLFEIVDTSSLWAELDIPEADVAKVSVGQSVVVSFPSLPGREFTGKLTYLAPEIDAKTRTVRARVPLSNPDGSLRANMFGQARISIAPRRSSIAIPRSALQRVAGVPLVFVQLAPDRYETRRVKLARSSLDPEWVELERGVKPDEPVVTTGSYQLKTETIKTSIGAGCCEVE